MLIRRAEVWQHGLADVRIVGERIAAIGQLPPFPGETVIDAAGGALLPGLHDHHIHMAGLAARAASVWCGPPDVTDEAALRRALTRPGNSWLRGIGYHESIMGLPDAAALDRLVQDRPLRLQHRSGRMWLFNSLALESLLSRAAPPPGLEREGGRYTGRMFDEDAWLRHALGSTPPDFAATSFELASKGVTGITDMSPRNDPEMAVHFAQQRASGTLQQRTWLAGAAELSDATRSGWRLGPTKLHLHEAALPDFGDAAAMVSASHARQRPVAIHCTTEVEMVFALAVLEDAGPLPGDRIEHASIADSDQIVRMASLGLAVCVQPHFITERGDRYLTDVEARHMPNLYRLASLAAAGLSLAGGSDSPFASADPWRAMQAAAERRTARGETIGAQEALSPEAALALYLADPEDLARQRSIAIGQPADLCLLSRPWHEARLRLVSADVRAAIISGNFIDQPPV